MAGGALLCFLVLYLDFSGYCDIVIGVAALMGFRLVENFNRPFLATNIQDFWDRWHISLTSISARLRVHAPCITRWSITSRASGILRPWW